MTIINGVNVNGIQETAERIRKDPKRGKFTIRTETEWADGCLSRTIIERVGKGEGEHQTESKRFVIEADEPPALQGEDRAPNAVEFVLHGLASCLVVGFAIRAALEGIEIEALKFQLEGDIDLNNFFGLSEGVRPGLQNVEVKCSIKANASSKVIETICQEVVKRSAVMDIVQNEVPISMEFVR